MRFNKVLTMFCICLFSVTCSAQEIHYSIVINAGSTGTRLNLFAYESASRGLPKISSTFWEDTQPALSSFANNPQAAGPALKMVLDDVAARLDRLALDKTTVNLSLLGTGGMRLLNVEVQKQIYDSVSSYIRQNYPFHLVSVKTISGKMEGIYDWLAVNYLENRFQPGLATLGALDVGGASTQIAYETADLSHSSSLFDLIIAGHQYHLFSKSFLGLFPAIATINAMPMANSCYPNNYIDANINGKFNIDDCQQEFVQLLINNQVTEQLSPYLTNQNFIAFSAAFNIYQFFAVNSTPDEDLLNNNIQQICSQPWQQLQTEYPYIPNDYLAAVCASGIYVSELFYHGYHLTGPQITVSDTIADQPVDWSLGALLFTLIH